jgi:hypothetical protein
MKLSAKEWDIPRFCRRKGAWYNTRKEEKRGVAMRLSEAFWSFFERTGSVVAYLLYCHYLRIEETIRDRAVRDLT